MWYYKFEKFWNNTMWFRMMVHTILGIVILVFLIVARITGEQQYYEKIESELNTYREMSIMCPSGDETYEAYSYEGYFYITNEYHDSHRFYVSFETIDGVIHEYEFQPDCNLQMVILPQ